MVAYLLVKMMYEAMVQLTFKLTAMWVESALRSIRQRMWNRNAFEFLQVSNL